MELKQLSHHVIDGEATEVEAGVIAALAAGIMGVTIDKLKVAGLRDKVKVMIGGAPVTQDYANQIGADVFAADASSAVRTARLLVL